MQKNNWKLLIKVICFIFLIFISLRFLFAPGMWFFGDASNWSKNVYEAVYSINTQTHVFSDSRYYLGYDTGILSFTRIAFVLYTYLLFNIFSPASSQAIIIIFAFIMSFVSFYLFSGIFFQKDYEKYAVSLMYVFNPVFFNLLNQDYILIYSAIPLFLYSLYKICFEKSNRLLYFVTSAVSVYMLISYIRFIQIGIIIIFTYFIYFLIGTKRISIKRLIYLVCYCLLLLTPSLLSVYYQINTSSQTATFYGEIFAKPMNSFHFFRVFNLFQSSFLNIYQNQFYEILGYLAFSMLFLLMVLKKSLASSKFYITNLILLTLGVTCYDFLPLYGPKLYPYLVRFIPFTVNGAVWSFFIIIIPFIFLIAYLLKDRKLLFHIFTFVFIAISIIPLIFPSNQFNKFVINDVPKNYKDYFITNKITIPEATLYIPDTCWYASYMNNAHVPTMCINLGLTYSPISFANPRLLSGVDYQLSKLLLDNHNVDNFRITHNLKDIILPNDFITKNNPNELIIGKKELIKLTNARYTFDININLGLNKNSNFSHYYYKNKNQYDYFIYSPKTFQNININHIFDTNSNIIQRPVFTDIKLMKIQSPKIEYKLSPLDQTKYYVKISISNNNQFALQFNQKFSTNWKLIWITKSDYEKQTCNDYKYYSITDNGRCIYKSNLLNITDTSYLFQSSVREVNHSVGNIVNNMWIVNPHEIITTAKDGNEIYGVIIYQKQIYYSWSILISFSIFILTLVLTLFQEIKRKYVNIKQI